jgi:hypothetical protein
VVTERFAMPVRQGIPSAVLQRRNNEEISVTVLRAVHSGDNLVSVQLGEGSGCG